MSSDITIIKGDFSTELPLPLAPGIRAGFPSPAQDYLHDTLDFNNDMIHHPEATFYSRVDGDSMRDAGILPGDIAVIDRSLDPRDGDIIVAYIDGEFTIKRLDLTHRSEGYIELHPANPAYSTIRIDNPDEFRVWGVIIWTIHNWRNY
jgi:DNA polymerase V